MDFGPSKRTWHGYTFANELTEVNACLKAFPINNHTAATARGWNMSRPEIFWKVATTYWPKGQGSKIFAERNPWAERMVDEACRWKLLGVSGCASSGKSFTLGGMWSWINWLASPKNTVIIVTSTTVQGSRNRVWKDICRLGQAAGGVGFCNLMPEIKILDATAQVRLDAVALNKTLKAAGIQTEAIVSAGSGITIIPGEQGKAALSNTKMVGMKSARIILVGDEFPLLGHGILETALGNLDSNPDFQMICLGNFSSRYDPFGVFTEPVSGWKSVKEDSEGWETKLGGYCLRFDGELSPNVVAGEDIFDGIYSNKLYQRHLVSFGRSSPTFWKMCKAFPMPEGGALSIYSENDFIAGDVHDKKVIWDSAPTPCAFLDPAFTNGGDRSQATAGLVGLSGGVKRLMITDEKELVSDVMEKGVPHDFQIARQFKKFCQGLGVQPKNAGFDSTGAGISFGSIVHQEWSSEVLPVCFGGAASDEPVSMADDERCCDRYFNRVSEIWVQGREYVRSGQIKGLSREGANELLARQFPDPKITTISLKKVKVEGKDDMKKRVGFSPDLGDSILGLVETARQRLGFIAAGYGSPEVKKDREILVDREIQLSEEVYDDNAFLQQDS